MKRRILLLAWAAISVASGCTNTTVPDTNRTVPKRAPTAHTDRVGVYNPLSGTFFLKMDGSEAVQVGFGNPEKVPLIGDWDGDGVSTVGVYDPESARFFVKNKNEPGFANLQVQFGAPKLRPLVGDWDGDGKDSFGVYDPDTATFSLTNTGRRRDSARVLVRGPDI